MRILNHGTWVNIPDIIRLTGKENIHIGKESYQ
jgi:hypothetical protein